MGPVAEQPTWTDWLPWVQGDSWKVLEGNQAVGPVSSPSHLWVSVCAKPFKEAVPAPLLLPLNVIAA